MGIKIKVKFDKNIFNTPRDEIVKSINDDLDYIGRDLLVTSRSLTPRDTGRLVNSGNLVRYKGTKASTSVSVSYLAKNIGLVNLLLACLSFGHGSEKFKYIQSISW